MYTYEDRSAETKADLLNHNSEILESVYTKDLQRKKEALTPDIQQTERAIYEAIKSGNISLEDVKLKFDEITKGTHYEMLKNSTTFKDFSDQDLIKEYATFLALAEGMDQNTAWQTVRADMQNYTNEHMPKMDGSAIGQYVTGKNFMWGAARLIPGVKKMHEVITEYREENPTKWGNFTRDITTQAWSDMGSFVTAIEGMTKGGEAKENWLQGLDDEGNPLPDWRNPRYWQGMNQYNMHDADKIYELQEKGGVSPFVNVTQAGDELDFLNWTNISNNLSQAIGQALPTVGIAALTGGASTAAQAAGSTFGKAALYTLYGGLRVAEIGVPAISGAHREGYEAYQNTTLALQQETDARIDAAVKERMQSIYNSEEGKKEIQSIMNVINQQAAEQ